MKEAQNTRIWACLFINGLEIEELSSIGLCVFATKDEEKENFLCNNRGNRGVLQYFSKMSCRIHASTNRRDPEKRSHVQGIKCTENSHFYSVFLCFVLFQGSRTGFYNSCINLAQALETQDDKKHGVSTDKRREGGREVEKRRKPTS